MPIQTLRTWLLHPYLTLAGRIILGSIFILSGLAKLPYPETLIWEINQYHILPRSLAMVYGYTLSPLEIALGIFLILGLFLRSTAFISGLVTLSFTIAKITALVRGLDIYICGCFGPAVPLLSVHSLLIDFVLLAIAFQIVFHHGDFLSLGGWLSKLRRARGIPPSIQDEDELETKSKERNSTES